MGVNTITSLLKNALEGAGVDLRNQKITASSSRKNLVQAGADSQVPGHWLSKYMGHKNVNSKLEYLTTQDKTHEACSLAINRRISGRKVNFIDVTNSLEKDQVQQKSPITNHPTFDEVTTNAFILFRLFCMRFPSNLQTMQSCDWQCARGSLKCHRCKSG